MYNRIFELLRSYIRASAAGRSTCRFFFPWPEQPCPAFFHGNYIIRAVRARSFFGTKCTARIPAAWRSDAGCLRTMHGSCPTICMSTRDPSPVRIARVRYCMERSSACPRGTGGARVSMFNPSSVNVICFDPNHNSDQARGYAAKYCSKPEKWYASTAPLADRTAPTRSY